MIAYIQHSDSHQYLQFNGSWTAERRDAQAFGTCMDAARVAWTFDLDQVEVVMTFGEARNDVHLPCRMLRSGRPTRSPGSIKIAH